MDFDVKTMVGDAIVGEIIGADFIGPFGGTYLFAAGGSDVARFFSALHFKKLGAENFHRLFSIGMLVSFFTTGNHDTRRLVGYSYR